MCIPMCLMRKRKKRNDWIVCLYVVSERKVIKSRLIE